MSYKLKSSTEFLSILNSHERDERIKFEEEKHQYEIDGKKKYIVSVTTLYHKYFTPFNPDKIIEQMMKSDKWKKGYKYYGMKKDEIKKLWSSNDASIRGTEMHKLIEKYINIQEVNKEENRNNVYKQFKDDDILYPRIKDYIRKCITKHKDFTLPDDPEYKMFRRFWRKFYKVNSEFRPYRTEWFIFDEELLLAGSVDFCVINEKRELIILDWKRSKEIKKKNKWQKGVKGLEHLDDCNLVHYSLQLNIYKYILEKNYNIRVIDLKLVILHPDNDKYKVIDCLNLEDEVKMIIKKRKVEIYNKKRNLAKKYKKINYKKSLAKEKE